MPACIADRWVIHYRLKTSGIYVIAELKYPLVNPFKEGDMDVVTLFHQPCRSTSRKISDNFWFQIIETEYVVLNILLTLSPLLSELAHPW